MQVLGEPGPRGWRHRGIDTPKRPPSRRGPRIDTPWPGWMRGGRLVVVNEGLPHLRFALRSWTGGLVLDPSNISQIMLPLGKLHTLLCAFANHHHNHHTLLSRRRQPPPELSTQLSTSTYHNIHTTNATYSSRTKQCCWSLAIISSVHNLCVSHYSGSIFAIPELAQNRVKWTIKWKFMFSNFGSSSNDDDHSSAWYIF